MSRRPFSIAELAARSRPTGYDASKSLKDLLRIATAQRDAGDAAKSAGDVEGAFIHYAKASTLMLEELPTHPRFGELTSSQKDAVVVHGQVILDSLGTVKALVSDRFSEWRAKHPDADLSAPVPTPTPQRQRQKEPRRSLEKQDERQEQRRHDEEQRARRARQHEETQRLVAEQERRLRRKDGVHEQVASITRHDQERIEREELLAEKKRTQEAALNAAAAAAFLGYPTPASLRVRPDSYEGHIERSASAAGVSRTASAARIHNPHTVSYPPAQPARSSSRAEHRREVSGPRDRPDAFGLRNESAPAAFNQNPAAAAALNAAYGPGLAYGNSAAAKPRKMSVASPVKDRPSANGHPPTTHAPVPRRRTASHGHSKGLFPDTRANGVFPDTRQQVPPPTFPHPQNDPRSALPFQPDPKPPFPQPDNRPELQGILPLESPSHIWAREPDDLAHVHAPAPRRGANPNGHAPPVRGSSYPPPITTTSPPPGPISYPNLMSSHQREQGYLPSSHSMFSFAGLAAALAAERDAQVFGTPPKTSLNTPPALLFQPNPEPTPPGANGKMQLPGGYANGQANGFAYPGQNAYPAPAPAVSGVPAYPSIPIPSSTNYATRPPPAIPGVVPPLGPPSTGSYGSPQTQQDDPDDGRLRQVLLPEEAIQKFMSIAKPNTLQKRETCGLLLGKRRSGTNGERSGFAVTTLLIPRQRGTSDTCEMVEEELILEFQEARGLITLGWIHTHPTQSCFMSSLDLHTHSGYQASLKEAFAIVCAPSQSPNVGIFRLTDPPGLQVILKCTAKEAFHPHTAGNIYTDADQGHVKMVKKLDLSIVDLRRHTG